VKDLIIISKLNHIFPLTPIFSSSYPLHLRPVGTFDRIGKFGFFGVYCAWLTKKILFLYPDFYLSWTPLLII
ncbi:MAG: hypothetical protein J7M30_03935, partial [Deltaproteobacteria bacterium]|nr:hypothetical protein [Deltaproteobacteria bacterium]